MTAFDPGAIWQRFWPQRIARACKQKLEREEWKRDSAYELVVEACQGCKTILDAGCGCGIQLAAFREYLSPDFPFHYTGLDASCDALAFAEEWFPEGDFVLGDLRGLTWPDQEFDGVVVRHVIEHHPPAEAQRALLETARVSRFVLALLFFLPPLAGVGQERSGTTSEGVPVVHHRADFVEGALAATGRRYELRKTAIPRRGDSPARHDQELWEVRWR